MKLKIKNLYLLFYVFILFLLFPNETIASTISEDNFTIADFENVTTNINTLNSKININEYGTALFKEKIKYEVGIENIVTRKLSTSNGSLSINSIKYNGQEMKYIPLEENLVKNTYQIQYLEDGIKIYMFAPENIQANIDLTYTIVNSGKLLKDAAVNDLILISNDENYIYNFDCSININNLFDYSNNHIEGSNITEYSNTGSLILKSNKEIDSEVRSIIFYDKNLLTTYNEDDTLKKDYLGKNGINFFDVSSGTNIAIGLTINLIILGFVLKNINKIKPNNDVKEINKLIKLSPIQASRIISGTSEIHSAVLANILDFKRRGIIDIKEIVSTTTNSSFLKTKPTANFVFTKKVNTPEIYGSERELYDYFFSFGDGYNVTLDFLFDSRIENTSIFEDIYSALNKSIKEELVKIGLFYPTLVHPISGSIIAIISIITFIVCILLIISKIFLAILPLLISIILAVSSVAVMFQATSLGKEQSTFYSSINTALDKTDNFDKYNFDQKLMLLIYKISYNSEYQKIKNYISKLNISKIDLLENSLFIESYNLALRGNENGKVKS